MSDDTREIDYDDPDTCEYADCENLAYHLVYSWELEKILKCCEPCSDIVIEESHPEYQHFCENCDSRLPIN